MHINSINNFSPKERIIQFLDYKGVSKRSVELKIEASNGYFGKIGEIVSDKLRNISILYPDLNLVWVITGNGNMLNGAKPYPIADELTENKLHEPTVEYQKQTTEADLKSFARSVERLITAIERRDEEIEELKYELRDLRGKIGKAG